MLNGVEEVEGAAAVETCVTGSEVEGGGRRERRRARSD